MIRIKGCNMLWEISYTCLYFAAQVMKNIFHQSFNAYKTDIEPRLSDVTLHNMQCSRRLFEIQLSHRCISAAYIEGDNVAVIVEGEAARVLNFDTGTPIQSIKQLLLHCRKREGKFALECSIRFQHVPSFQSSKYYLRWNITSKIASCRTRARQKEQCKKMINVFYACSVRWWVGELLLHSLDF